MLKIYGSDLSSPANKVRFVANALKLEYEYIFVNLRAGEQRNESFLKLNPFGKIPVIDDDGFTLFESGAIIKYLATKHKSSLYPQELNQRAIVDQWLEFVSMQVVTALGRVLYNRVFAPIIKVEVDERSMADGLQFLSKYLPVIDQQLAKHPYLAGETLTLADINLLAGLDPAEVARVDLSPYQNIVNWRNEQKKKNFYTKCYKEYGESLKQKAAPSTK